MADDHCCKVGRVVTARGLSTTEHDGLDKELVARWLGKNDYPEMGLRTLAEWLNKRMLTKAYTEQGRSIAETRVDSEYEALVGDNEITRAEIIDDLRTDGVDGERLVDDFVSKSTVDRHLRQCLGVEKSTTDEPDTGSSWEGDKINYAKRTALENATQAVQSLSNKGRLPGGADAEVEVRIVLSCPECSARVRFEDALDRGYICRDHLGTVDPEFARMGKWSPQ